MPDPRAANCRAFQVDSMGKVIGVELDIDPRPNTRFECVSVQLINEYQAQGQTVATISVFGANNIPLSDPVVLAWPWPSINFSAYPGNSKIPAEHVISNKYFPPSKGPLAVYVGSRGNPDSDLVGGLGLPGGHHVSYNIVYRERGTTQPPIDPPPSGDLEARVTALEATIERMRMALA